MNTLNYEMNRVKWQMKWIEGLLGFIKVHLYYIELSDAF